MAGGTAFQDDVVLPDGPVSDATSSKKIPDPGDGNPIPVTDSGYIMLSISGSETNSLPNPPRAGMSLELFVSYVSEAQRLITSNSPINKAGNDEMTFDATREYIKLTSIEITEATFVWQVVSNDGVDLSSD